MVALVGWVYPGRSLPTSLADAGRYWMDWIRQSPRILGPFEARRGPQSGDEIVWEAWPALKSSYVPFPDPSRASGRTLIRIAR